MLNCLIVIGTVWLAAHSPGGVDFSGSWRLERDRSNPQSSGPEVVLQIVQGPTDLQVNRKGQALLSVTLYFDGRVATANSASNEPLHPTLDYVGASAKARWDGTRLIVEGTVPAQGGRLPATLREVWRVDSNSGLLMIDKVFNNGSAEFRVTEAFSRVTQ